MCICVSLNQPLETSEKQNAEGKADESSATSCWQPGAAQPFFLPPLELLVVCPGHGFVVRKFAWKWRQEKERLWKLWMEFFSKSVCIS